jgi:hypothetical protein
VPSRVDTLMIECADLRRAGRGWPLLIVLVPEAKAVKNRLPLSNEFCVLRGPEEGWSPKDPGA